MKLPVVKLESRCSKACAINMTRKFTRRLIVGSLRIISIKENKTKSLAGIDIMFAWSENKSDGVDINESRIVEI